MELAVHLKDPAQIKALKDFPGHLTGLYEEKDLKEQDWIELIHQGSYRIYLGDEFCLHRLPHQKELDALYQSAKEENREVTFLTPPLPDEGLDRCSPLFDFLKDRDPETEVVVNDWGMLLFLKERYPLFQLSLGRLLNKGFKDPRLLDTGKASEFSVGTEGPSTHCTYDFVAFQEKMLELKVTRLERDLLPYGEHNIESVKGLKASFYFPFGYITTGRICWIASFGDSARKKFSLSNGCHRLCDKLTLKLTHVQTSLPLFQGGNTVFYLYPPSILGSLIKRARLEQIRLIYQGLVI